MRNIENNLSVHVIVKLFERALKIFISVHILVGIALLFGDHVTSFCLLIRMSFLYLIQLALLDSFKCSRTTFVLDDGTLGKGRPIERYSAGWESEKTMG